MKISVIIPAFNCAKTIGLLLDSLQKQTYKDFEIIVVNDGSQDETPFILQRYKAKLKNLVVIHQKNHGPAHARNTGVYAARGEILHFIDSDCIAPENLLIEHLKHHVKNKNLIVQGQLVRLTSLTEIGKKFNPLRDFSQAFFDTANVSVRRSHVLSVGGFDHRNFRKGWEDHDLGYRLIHYLGLQVKRLRRKGFVWHYEGEWTKISDVKHYFKDMYLNGYTGVKYHLKHRTFETMLASMAHPVFLAVAKILFVKNWPESKRFLNCLSKLLKSNKKDKALILIRLAGYHFYIKGVKEALLKATTTSSTSL